MRQFNIAIFGRHLKPEYEAFVKELFEELGKRNHFNLYIFDEYLHALKSKIRIHKDYKIFSSYEDYKTKEIDFCITLGGDGTILEAITVIRDCETPILGFNLGRLGFLAMFEKNRIAETITAIEQNNFSLDPRTLLSLDSSEAVFGDLNFALNDFTILKRDTSSMVTVHTYVNGEFLNSYWADGIIVATPTGSTGYSLSCGGPIIFPRSSNFVITPVAPHNLNVRPIVLSDDVVISFEIEGRTDNFLCTLDSRYNAIKSTCQLAIRKCTFKANILKPYDRNFLYMIREKLHWGIDSRN
jgi:NAD+ kinase